MSLAGAIQLTVESLEERIKELEQKFSEAFGQGNAVRVGPNALWRVAIEKRVEMLELLHAGGLEKHTERHTRLALSWTKEVPKKPDFYWCRLYGRRFPCEIILKDGNPYVKLLGEPEPTSATWMMPGAEWYGPIEPPE